MTVITTLSRTIKRRAMNFLFVATDAGGARNLAPVARELLNERYQVKCITCKDSIFQIFKENQLQEHTLKISYENGAISKIFKEEKWNTIVLGTAVDPILERAFIRLAKEQNIKTVTILDEWYDFSSRFTDAFELDFLTDHVIVPDETAKNLAIAEGLPSEILFPLGSPNLSYLIQQLEKEFSPPPIWEKEKNTKVLFISETHKVDYGCHPKDIGILGSFLGYNEDIVLEDVLICLKDMNDYSFVERLHPNHCISDQNKDWFVSQGDIPLWNYLAHADLVIGMRSMALLEAALFEKVVISHQPNLVGPDKCTANTLNLTIKTQTRDELRQAILNASNFNTSFTREKIITDAILNIKNFIIKQGERSFE